MEAAVNADGAELAKFEAALRRSGIARGVSSLHLFNPQRAQFIAERRLSRQPRIGRGCGGACWLRHWRRRARVTAIDLAPA